jgi:hypothetical protein
MDWNECIKNNIIKNIKLDKNRIKAIKKIANEKIKSATILPEDHLISKITLFYDALRELLEAKALEEGFKIYNHECYNAFLKEILHKSNEANLFNEMRKIRNGINYYGQEIKKEESIYIIKTLKKLIKKFNK